MLSARLTRDTYEHVHCVGRSDGGQWHAHLDPLVSHEVLTGASVLSPAPIPPVYLPMIPATGCDAQVAQYRTRCYTLSIERDASKLKGGAGYEEKAHRNTVMHLTSEECVLLIRDRVQVCWSLEEEQTPPARA